MSSLPITKRSYHPLVVFFFYADLLSPEQLAQIPKTTIDYWRGNNHAVMFGYEWVSSFYSKYDDFNSIQKHKIIFKSARFCSRVFDTFSAICTSMKSYKSVFKNNAAVIINTIDYLNQEIRLDKVCRIFNISMQQYYRFKNKIMCTASVLNLCYKTHPLQLTIAECSAIKEAVNNPVNTRKRLATIWYQLMREGKLYCSRSTLYKYAKLVSEQPERTKINKPKLQIQSYRIFEFIHVDTTFLTTLKDGAVRAVIIKDNYSKKILHKGVVDNGESKWIALLLKEMFSMHGLCNHKEQITLVSDGGSENKGEVLQWVDGFDSNHVSKKTARTPDFIFTNNEIESTFNIFKNEFLGDREINDTEQAKQFLEEFHSYNDNQRYPIALYGLTPQEVFDGAVIDKHRFRENIQQAKNIRYLVNKAGRFCDVCSER